MKNNIIDIDAEFDGVEFDENAIKRATAAAEYSRNAKKHIETRIKNGWREAQAKVLADPEIRKRRAASLKNQSQESKDRRAKSCMKCLITLDGPFDSIKSAVMHYAEKLGFADSGARKRLYKWLREDPTNFYYISKEEYIMLTGKDV